MMVEYVVECVRLKQNKIGKVKTKVHAVSPRTALDTFINLYLEPIEEPEIKYGGLHSEKNKYISYKVKLKNREDVMFLLNCKYIGEKNTYALTLV